MNGLSVMATDSNVKNQWVRVYMDTEIRRDPHEDFSHLLGISRQDAKELCYKIMYSSPFIRYEAAL